MADVTLTGPLFDGTAERAAARGCEAIREKVSAAGAKLSAALLEASIRHHETGRSVRGITTTTASTVYQTGKYTMPVVVDPVTSTLVTSTLATYGPWLEGTGSRNLTTKFKGYHSFRLACQALDLVAQELADEAFAPYVREMN